MIAVLKVPFEQFARVRSAELLKASQTRHEAAKAKEVGRLNLTDVLAGPQHAAILKEFQDHCRQQRMLEGLDFIVSSTEFARIEEPGAVLTQGVRLYQEFLSPQSGREINISFVQREKIKRAGRDLSRLLHPEDRSRTLARLHAQWTTGEALAEGLRSEGFLRPGVNVDAQALLDFLAPFLEPLHHEEYTLDRAWLRAQAARIQDPRRPDFFVGTRLNLPPEYLLIHRVWLGGIGVLAQIGGTIPMRELMTAHLPGIDEAMLPPIEG